MLSSWASYKCLLYRSHYTNGYYFYTKAHDDKCIVQSNELTSVAQTIHISSAKDKKNIICEYVILWGDKEHMGVRLHHILLYCASV